MEKQSPLPVLDSQHKIVGLLSEKDFLRFLITEKDQINYLHGTTVKEVVSAGVIATDPVSDIRSDLLRTTTQDPPLSLWI